MTAVIEETTAFIVDEPGIYDIPEDLYHADPVPGGSLSVSGAKVLLNAAAKFAYQREHGSVPTRSQELGTAAHKLVLGVGQELAVLPYDNYQRKAAQEEAKAARAEGKLPLLAHEHETVKGMAAALRAHPTARALFDPDAGTGGRPEMSAFWVDDEFGIWRRLRWDWMPYPDVRRRPAVGDYKTCVSASRASFAKAVANYGYHMQADWYTTGYHAMFGVEPAFVFVAQEKEPPYLVATYQLRRDALELGRARNELAMRRYAEHTESGHWPGYSTEVEWIDLPGWAYREDIYE